VSTKVDPIIGDSHITLIKLIDRVRMLDNDLIRLNAKLDMILQEQEKNVASRNNTTTVNHIDPG
jgi:hypothetical protein